MTRQQQVGIFFSLESITVVIMYLSYFSNFYIPFLCWDYDRYIKRGACWPFLSLNRKGQERNWRSKVICPAYEWKTQLSRVCCRRWAALRSGPLVRKAALFQFIAGNFEVEISKAVFVWNVY